MSNITKLKNEINNFKDVLYELTKDNPNNLQDMNVILASQKLDSLIYEYIFLSKTENQTNDNFQNINAL